MRNQYMAKVLVHNKVVSEDQVKAHWGEISDSTTRWISVRFLFVRES